MQKLEVKVNGLTVYANPNTMRLRLGAKGKATTIDTFLCPLPKGAKRAIRKALYKLGHRRMAGAGIHN